MEERPDNPEKRRGQRSWENEIEREGTDICPLEWDKMVRFHSVQDKEKRLGMQIFLGSNCYNYGRGRGMLFAPLLPRNLECIVQRRQCLLCTVEKLRKERWKGTEWNRCLYRRRTERQPFFSCLWIVRFLQQKMSWKETNEVKGNGAEKTLKWRKGYRNRGDGYMVKR